jgi:hypothetical protein
MFMAAKNATMPVKYIEYSGTESEANVARQPDVGMSGGVGGSLAGGAPFMSIETSPVPLL